MVKSLPKHWLEYLTEAAALGSFMISAGVFTTLLEYPGSAVLKAVPTRRRRLLSINVNKEAAWPS